MIPGVTLLAAHEAGHFIMYLLNCRDEITLPGVYELALTRRRSRGHVSLRGFDTPEYLQHLINSDLPESSKSYALASVRRQIKRLLAGLAAELIILEFTAIYDQALRRIYKRDKAAGADIPRAIVYNDILLARPSGVADLAPLLYETINDLAPHTDHVIKIGALLDKEQLLTGDQLGPFIDEFMNH